MSYVTVIRNGRRDATWVGLRASLKPWLGWRPMEVDVATVRVVSPHFRKLGLRIPFRR